MHRVMTILGGSKCHAQRLMTILGGSKCHAQRLMTILGGSKCHAQSNDDSRWLKMSGTQRNGDSIQINGTGKIPSRQSSSMVDQNKW